MDNLKEILQKRRSHYSLKAASPVSDEEIRELVDTVVQHVPSAFNSQSTRMVLLLGEHHDKLWEIVKEELRKIVPEESFGKTREKIDTCFGAGYGTVLFYEDQQVVRQLQEQSPLYADRFPVWSEHTSAMHQHTLWLLLDHAGFGASLQHYNPVIDRRVARQWKIDPEWKLIAQMPFGTPLTQPGPKEFLPLEQRSIVFE